MGKHDKLFLGFQTNNIASPSKKKTAYHLEGPTLSTGSRTKELLLDHSSTSCCRSPRGNGGASGDGDEQPDVRMSTRDGLDS